jgi:dTDP-4-amino-4,6-dideoxy-D-galactose acyltransferase
MSQPGSESSRRCSLLEWDSELFGRRIARFEGACYTRADADATRRFCAEHCVDCVYILLDAADTASLATAQASGADFVDVRMTLEGPLDAVTEPADQARGPETSGEIRPATERDLPDLRRLAAAGHRRTRFYADSRFAADRVDRLYQTWIEKSCRGYADAVFVIEVAREAAGYVTCHLDDGVTGRIGLIAVRQDLRGHGVGAQLLRAARRCFLDAGCRSWTVATQGSNVAALRLYQTYGFHVAAVQVWFHLWPAEADRGRL